MYQKPTSLYAHIQATEQASLQKKCGIRQTRIEKKMPRTEAFANAFVFQFTTAKFDS